MRRTRYDVGLREMQSLNFLGLRLWDPVAFSNGFRKLTLGCVVGTTK